LPKGPALENGDRVRVQSTFIPANPVRVSTDMTLQKFFGLIGVAASSTGFPAPWIVACSHGEGRSVWCLPCRGTAPAIRERGS